MTENNILVGQIRTNSKGKGFFEKENGDFVNIDSKNLNTALDRDTVEIIITGKNKWKEEEGKVLKIKERNKKIFVGRIEVVEKSLKPRRGDKGARKIKQELFISDNPRFYPEVEFKNGARIEKLVGKKILIKIDKWKDANKKPVAVVEKVLGKIGENETEMLAAVYDRGFVTGFSAEVEEAAAKLKEKSGKMIAEQKKIRRNLTDLDVFTIDPADAKDFDDALSLRKLENGNYEVGIHIADPTFFVQPESILDKVAQERATSVYLVDRTIPMLPEVLSNDLCSLNPNEEKLVFSSLFEMDKDANVISEWFGDAVIKSKKRYNYMSAQKTLDNGFGDLYSELKALSDLADKLEEKRKKAGSIEFNSVEVKFKLDKNKFPIKVYVKPRVRTMEIIEEFMLLDNKRVSMKVSLDSKGTVTKNPFIYRIHDKPKAEKVKEAIDFLAKLGHNVDLNGDGSMSSKEINAANRKFKGTDEEGIISITLLRAMEKAKYSTDPRGHFGLAFKYYTHFTSPIRRYPDFVAHRLLRRYLAGEKIPQSEIKKIAADAKHSSEQEVKAVDAERASISFMYAKYYSKRIGEKFNGIITGIKKFGIFVEESKTKAQGLIPTRDIADDYFAYDEKGMTLTGERTGHQFRLGQRINTEVVKVDINLKAIDLKFTGKIETKKSKKDFNKKMKK